MTTPFFETTDLFERGVGNYVMYRIPGLCTTPNGAVLAWTEARQGRGGDWDDIDIVMRRSFDNGVTWDEPRCIVDHNTYGPGPINNCNSIVDTVTGEVHFLYCYNYSRAFYMKTADDGATFTEPVEITATFEQFRPEYNWNWLAVGLPMGIQLRNGRLVIPIWISESTTSSHAPNRCATIYSDDHGQTWQRGDIVEDVVPNNSETVGVELEDGSVLLNIRNRAGVRRRLYSISQDGATNWSIPQLDPALLEPTCEASLLRYSWASEGRSRILFCNPDNDAGKDAKGSVVYRVRRNVTIKMSYDDCKTWPVSKVIEPGMSGYSALAICPDKTILCLFERGKPDGTDTDDYLTLARFNLGWLTDGDDPA
ncbi:MAG: exo-alpha-sialidase [Anaerolineaceae bacterium]|nr:exo-alpha-sialidase [Anaerolineaceae bacterium]